MIYDLLNTYMDTRPFPSRERVSLHSLSELIRSGPS